VAHPIEKVFDGLKWKTIKLPDPSQRMSGLPVAVKEALLTIGARKFRCYQMTDGRRLIHADDLEDFINDILAKEQP
jgi:hypothetical protein